MLHVEEYISSDNPTLTKKRQRTVTSRNCLALYLLWKLVILRKDIYKVKDKTDEARDNDSLNLDK